MNKNVKRILIFLLIIACMAVSSYATANYLNATQVTYNTKEGETVQLSDALNDLYNKATDAQNWKKGFNTTTAEASHILSGKTAYKITRDGNNVTSTPLTGTMVNRNAGGGSIKPGNEYTIEAGYYDGTGKVTVDTSDATATAAQILSGKTAYVNGNLVNGIATLVGSKIYECGYSDADNMLSIQVPAGWYLVMYGVGGKGYRLCQTHVDGECEGYISYRIGSTVGPEIVPTLQSVPSFNIDSSTNSPVGRAGLTTNGYRLTSWHTWLYSCLYYAEQTTYITQLKYADSGVHSAGSLIWCIFQ